MLKCYQTQFMIDVVDLTQLLIESGHLFQMHIIDSNIKTCQLRPGHFPNLKSIATNVLRIISHLTIFFFVLKYEFTITIL